MSQFQNCAPAPDGGLIGSNTNVSIIDGSSDSKLQFIVENYYVKDDVDTVNIEGVCTSEVDYRIIKLNADGSESLLSEGEADCSSGSFIVSMTSTNSHLQSCDEQLEVEASQVNSLDLAKTLIRKNCF